MFKRNRTSIQDLPTLLSGIDNRENSAAASISIITGDADTEGSVANMEKVNKEYIDSIFANIDLSQIQHNLDAINVLNGDGTVTDSVVDKTNKLIEHYLTPFETTITNLDTRVTDTDNKITKINSNFKIKSDIDYGLTDVPLDTDIVTNEDDAKVYYFMSTVDVTDQITINETKGDGDDKVDWTNIVTIAEGFLSGVIYKCTLTQTDGDICQAELIGVAQPEQVFSYNQKEYTVDEDNSNFIKKDGTNVSIDDIIAVDEPFIILKFQDLSSAITYDTAFTLGDVTIGCNDMAVSGELPQTSYALFKIIDNTKLQYVGTTIKPDETSYVLQFLKLYDGARDIHETVKDLADQTTVDSDNAADLNSTIADNKQDFEDSLTTPTETINGLPDENTDKLSDLTNNSNDRVDSEIDAMVEREDAKFFQVERHFLGLNSDSKIYAQSNLDVFSTENMVYIKPNLGEFKKVVKNTEDDDGTITFDKGISIIDVRWTHDDNSYDTPSYSQPNPNTITVDDVDADTPITIQYWTNDIEA